MSYRAASVTRSIAALLCVAAAVLPVWAQARKQSLANLIEEGDHKAALAQIRAGADVNEAQPDGTRPIQWAVYRLDYEVLDALIAKKAKVDVANEFGSTPLAEAAKLADARMVRTLLNAGAQPDKPNQDGETALMLALKTGALPVVEMLIKAGANVNARETFHNQTALMWAASAPKNTSEMVKLLLAKGADFKPRALYSDWPSQITSEPRAQYRPVGGLTALLYAARGGCYGCVESLIQAGADVNYPTPEGVTPLMIALDNDYNDVAKLLLDRGANPNLWDWWGRTPLYIAIDRREAVLAPLRTGILTIRVPRSTAPEPRSSSGPPVSNLEMIKILLAAGVDLDPQLNMHRPSRGGNSGRFVEEFYNTGCTPLLRATIAGDVEVVRDLLDKGASPNISGMGLTPFLIAAGVGTGGRGTGLASSTSSGGQPNTAIMDLLLAHGADVNAQVTGTHTYSLRISRAPSATEGMTALHVAAQKGRSDEVRYLLAKGARTDLIDSNGRKPIDLAASEVARAGAVQAPAAAASSSAGNAAGDPAGAPPAKGTPNPSERVATAGGAPGAASVAEIRALLQNAVSQR
ncbi:MAG: ankyrin repeat domain-containing protein [Bryobacterales bacterium]|nr:ankyrin repeat domain-containing protein [Bryobacterales bacterium]